MTSFIRNDIPSIDKSDLTLSSRHPEHLSYQWQIRTQLALEDLDFRKQQVESELSKCVLDSQRNRLETILRGIETQAALTYELMSDYLKDQQPKAELILKQSLPKHHHLQTYEDAMFRDWHPATENENQQACSFVKSIWPELNAKVSVWGSGASRLAYDLAAADVASDFHLFDFNPMLLGLAKKMFAGESLTAARFASNAMEFKNIVESFHLKAPSKASGNFQFYLCDLSEDILESEVSEVLLTPWFVDVFQMEFQNLCRMTSRFMKLDSCWVIFGPLGFNHFNERYNHSLEELIEILELEGFEICKKKITDLPYLNFPASGQKRTERLLGLCVKKKQKTKAPTYKKIYPKWIIDTKMPVPKDPHLLKSLPNHISAMQVLARIDGKKSISDIAAELAEAAGVKGQDIELNVASFLTQYL